MLTIEQQMRIVANEIQMYEDILSDTKVFDERTLELLNNELNNKKQELLELGKLKNKEINKDLYDIRIYKVDDKVVGYSVMEHYPSFENHGHVYLIRKSISDYRNLCLYIDYDTFREKTKYENSIIINWGCSSGGVKKYKLNKFKLAYIKKLYFYNLKKNQS